MEETMFGREVIFKSLMGSREFGFANERSDYDFKVCLKPLPDEKSFQTYVLGRERKAEYNVFLTHDIEAHLFDPRFIPLWFSNNVKFNKPSEYPDVYWLFEHREQIVHANIYTIYRNILDGWESMKVELMVLDRYLFVTYWLQLALLKYLKNDFKDFNGCLRGDLNGYRKRLLSMKTGELKVQASLSHIREVNSYLKEQEHKFKAVSSEFNSELEEVLLRLRGR